MYTYVHTHSLSHSLSLSLSHTRTHTHTHTHTHSSHWLAGHSAYANNTLQRFGVADLRGGGGATGTYIYTVTLHLCMYVCIHIDG